MLTKKEARTRAANLARQNGEPFCVIAGNEAGEYEVATYRWYACGDFTEDELVVIVHPDGTTE